DENHPTLVLEAEQYDSYALRIPEKFPVDINEANYEMLLRVPGIGVKTAMKIVKTRLYQRLNMDHLQRMGVVVKRAKFFITCPGIQERHKDYETTRLRQLILAGDTAARLSPQLSLFG